jgi:hypothetical protein
VAENPLKKYFRQPKIYVDLPSKGAFNRPGTILGDPVQIPVYGMTGMDEIISKTPDALLSGESTMRIIQSCMPNITDASDLSILDLEFIMAAIRIATYGNEMEIKHTCSACQELNDYEIDLGNIIKHFASAKFESSVPAKEFTVKIRPLTFKEYTAFQIRNFNLQRTLLQLAALENPDDHIDEVRKAMEDMAMLQRDLMIAQIEGVEISEGLVEERSYIDEWLKNVDQEIFERVRKQIEANRSNFDVPRIPVKCPSCEHEEETTLLMEQSRFFAKA